MDFLQAMARAIPWAKDAACADPKYAKWTWTVDKTSGREIAPTVVKLFEVCGTCPVRRPCMLSALEETEFSVMGVWGGTVMSERSAAWRDALDAIKADETFTMPSTQHGNSGTVSGRGPHAARGSAKIAGADRRRLAEEIADKFEATFDERLQTWRDGAEEYRLKREEQQRLQRATGSPVSPRTGVRVPKDRGIGREA